MLSLSQSRRRSFQGAWPHLGPMSQALGVKGSPRGAASWRRLTDHLKRCFVSISELNSGSLATVHVCCPQGAESADCAVKRPKFMLCLVEVILNSSSVFIL